MKPLLTAAALILYFFTSAQKREELFDYSFKPSKRSGFYYVVTEKEDSLWHRKAFYVSQKTQAMEGWYKDEEGKVGHGKHIWFHTNRSLKSEGMYVDGKKEGTWLTWNEKGALTDSTTYKGGRRIGIGMRWHDNGMAADSIQFDGQGNSVHVSWYDDGQVASTGRWTQDTLKNGPWKYFHKNGTVMATENYVNGKQVACTCYDEVGQALDTALCKEQEAAPAGGLQEWRRFLERNLGDVVQAKSKVLPAGTYSVVIRFIVEKDGSLNDFVALTAYGKGLEEDIISLLKKAKRWTPGKQWGRAVRSYHTQPITFLIQN